MRASDDSDARDSTLHTMWQQASPENKQNLTPKKHGGEFLPVWSQLTANIYQGATSDLLQQQLPDLTAGNALQNSLNKMLVISLLQMSQTATEENPILSLSNYNLATSATYPRLHTTGLAMYLWWRNAFAKAWPSSWKHFAKWFQAVLRMPLLN